MKIPFFSSSAPKEPEPISYASEFRDFIQNNAPLDFETKMARARPFIFASFIAWPAFWMYRGMDWCNRAPLERSLVSYINRTFHQAKLMQFAILSLGLMFAVYEESPLLHKVNYMLKGINDEDDYRASRRLLNLLVQLCSSTNRNASIAAQDLTWSTMGILENLFQKKSVQQLYFESAPREVNLGEEVRRLMHRRDIEATMEAASPFLVSAALSWPTVWLYRGFDWHSHKGKETLPLYIRKTFFQAKAVQFAVLAMGLIYVVGSTATRNT